MTRMDMTLNLAGITAAKTGERGSKNEISGSEGGFGDALAANTKKQMQPRQPMEPKQPSQRSDEAISSLRDLIHAIATENQSSTDDDGLLQPDFKLTVAKSKQQADDLSIPTLQEDDEALAQAENIVLADIETAVPMVLPMQPEHAAPKTIAPGSNYSSLIPAPNTAGTDTAEIAGRSQIHASALSITEGAPGDLSGQSQLQTSESKILHRSQNAASATQIFEPMGSATNSGDTAQPRVSIQGFATSPAPVSPIQPGATTSALLADIQSDPSWRAAAEAASRASQRAHNHHSVSTLRIQLNPAELGMVNARLTIANSQLQVEIHVETSEARQRLTSDSDAIIKAMRAIGFDVDRVTIHQPSQNSAATTQPSAQGRDPAPQQQGQQQAQANEGGRDGQRNNGDSGSRHGQTMAEITQEISGSGVYI